MASVPSDIKLAFFLFGTVPSPLMTYCEYKCRLSGNFYLFLQVGTPHSVVVSSYVSTIVDQEAIGH
jgi:hypothetical protein